MKIEVGKKYVADNKQVYAIKRRYRHEDVHVGTMESGGEWRFTPGGWCIDTAWNITLVSEYTESTNETKKETH